MLHASSSAGSASSIEFELLSSTMLRIRVETSTLLPLVLLTTPSNSSSAGFHRSDIDPKQLVSDSKQIGRLTIF